MRDLKSLSRDLRQLQRDLTRAAERANARIADGTRALARAYSSGGVKSVVLQTPLGVTHNFNPFTGKVTKLSSRRHGSSRGLGAPYGHGSSGWLGPRGPIPYGDPSWINKQTGKFFRSWKIVRASSTSGAPMLIVRNDAPHAEFLEQGTSKMIARPLGEHLQAYVAKVGPVIFQEEFDRIWRVRIDTK